MAVIARRIRVGPRGVGLLGWLLLLFWITTSSHTTSLPLVEALRPKQNQHQHQMQQQQLSNFLKHESIPVSALSLQERLLQRATPAVDQSQRQRQG